MFSLGGQELSATLDTDQSLTFHDLSALASLDAADFFNLRLAVNHDAGNILWEWVFGRHGLQVQYYVPGQDEQEVFQHMDEDNQAQDGLSF